MTVYTETRVFRASKEEVFAYLAEIENLPEWASEFARELKVVDGRHVVVNGLGELFFEIRADRERGIVDMLAGPTPDALALFPVRVVDAPAGSVLTFTMVQQPGQPDEQFEGQHESLVRELANLERRFG
jgi:hypothetical protein